MFAFVEGQQWAALRRDAKSLLVQSFVMIPALLLVLAWVIWWGAGLPGNTLEASSLDDAFKGLVLIQMLVIAIMAVPAIICLLSDPVGGRPAVGTLTTGLASLLPYVGRLFGALKAGTTAQPVIATPSGVRFASRPQLPIPAFGFSPGASPQIE